MVKKYNFLTKNFVSIESIIVCEYIRLLQLCSNVLGAFMVGTQTMSTHAIVVVRSVCGCQGVSLEDVYHSHLSDLASSTSATTMPP